MLLAPFVYAAVFALLGPPLGSLAISLPMVFDEGAVALLYVAAFGAMSYYFGLVPAVLTGICAGFAHRLPALVFVPLCAALGAAFSLGFATVMDFGGEAGQALQYMAAPGALGATAAALCTVPIGRSLRR